MKLMFVVRIIQSGYKIRHVDNAIVYHEMAESHNRNSPVDINYIEIIKNVHYFILKNFGNEARSYIVWPFLAIFYWIRIDIDYFLFDKISLKGFLLIFINIMLGSISGIKKGLLYKHVNRLTPLLIWNH